MKKFILFLDRILTPTLILSYFAYCIVLLAVAEKGKFGLFLAMFWAGGMMWLMQWGIRKAFLRIVRKGRTGKTEFAVLVRTTEVVLLLCTVAVAVAACFLPDVLATWLMVPVLLFGVRGAIRIDATYVIS
jgi:hypothetical protein